MSDTVYNLITLDAESMIASNGYMIEEDHGNQKVTFQYDLSDSETADRDIILFEKEQPDCALFHQLVQCLSEDNKSVDDIKNILRQSLIYIDFDSVYKDTNYVINVTGDYKSQKTARLEGDAGVGYRLQWMFDPENGIQITFDGEDKKVKTWKTFVPFDKSSSMARNSQITFIDKDLKAKVENRLLLDMCFYYNDKDKKNIKEDLRIKVVSSKYYAYRGLYLSAGYRIEEGKDIQKSEDTVTDFQLNEKTVIVIDDAKEEQRNKTVYAASNKKPYDEQSPWLFETKAEDFDTKPFDGEGLICPEYAAFISRQLQTEHGFNKAKPSHSFQIRMPFTKGMLHETDFIRFITDRLEQNNITEPDTVDLEIEDYFHVKRNLRDAKIILTKSMFKCCGWLEKWQETKKFEDPMKYFFDKFKEYGHALYITSTDARFSDNASVPLNYQFLSTLDIKPEDFESMIQWHVEHIKYDDYKQQDESDVNGKEEAENDAVKRLTKHYSVRDKCINALSRNNAFWKDALVKEQIRQIEQERAKNLCIGKLYVPGEQRYLSGDLLELLRRIYQGIDGIEDTTTLKKERLYPTRFYMPENKLKLKVNKPYVVLRNPHLSRNEQCLLLPYIKPNSLYTKYFSHLTGVIMVASGSLVPMALSGADFDGDLVKIICDYRIINAVKRGVYNRTTKTNINNGVLKRSLPVIQIPNIETKDDFDPGSIPMATVNNTFSNQIGLISNCAVEIAKHEYDVSATRFTEIIPNAYERGICCAGCTTVTGLEIDAAKTGEHPTANIVAIKKFDKLISKADVEAIKKDGKFRNYSVFLKAKKALKPVFKSKRRFTPTIEVNTDGTLSAYESKKKRTPILSDIPVYTAVDVVNNIAVNIDRLPGLYLDYLLLAKEIRKRVTPDLTDSICFTFQNNPGGDEKPDIEKDRNLAMLIQAYLAIKSLAYRVENFRVASKNRQYLGHIKTLLKLQYDSLYNQLPGLPAGSFISVTNAFVQAYDDILATLKNKADTVDAINRMIAERWQYAKKDRREKLIGVILNTDKELNPPTIALLSNFANNGFMIFYYYLKDIQNNFTKDMTTDDYIANNKKLEEVQNSIYENNEYYKKLYDVYVTCEHRKNEWKRKLPEKCHEMLADIFGNDMDTALKYVYANNAEIRSRFLWDVFTNEEIMRNVFIPGKAD